MRGRRMIDARFDPEFIERQISINESRKEMTLTDELPARLITYPEGEYTPRLKDILWAQWFGRGALEPRPSEADELLDRLNARLRGESLKDPINWKGMPC